MQPEHAEGLPYKLYGEVCGEQRMEPARRQPGNFEVQLARLLTEQEVAEAATDQPCPAAGGTNELFNVT